MNNESFNTASDGDSYSPRTFGSPQGQQSPDSLSQMNIPLDYQSGGGFSGSSSYTPQVGRLAGFWFRVAYTIVDGVIIGIVYFAVAMIFLPPTLNSAMSDSQSLSSSGAESANELPPEFFTTVLIISIVGLVISFLYMTLLLGFTGSTFGQKLLGVYVVQDDTGRTVKGHWGTAALRTIAYMLFSIIYIIYLLDVLWCIWDSKKQTLHDKLATTLVVHKH